MVRKAAKSLKKPTGCRKCKYRVAILEKGSYIPKCCFQFKVDDKKVPDCGMFTESSYYELHPEEP